VRRFFIYLLKKESNFSGGESELGSVHYSKRLFAFPIHPHTATMEKKALRLVVKWPAPLVR